MENNPVPLPVSLASPALMVLATTAEAAAARDGTDAGAPSKPQVPQDLSNPSQTEKGINEIHDSFPAATSTAKTTYDNGQSFASFVPPPVLPPHLAYPRFVPPDAEHSLINYSGNGAFQPPTKLECDPGSAFVPVKKLKTEGDTEKNALHEIEGVTYEGRTKEVTIERPDSVGSRSSEGTNPDETKFLRRTVRKRTEELRHTLCCPVCGVTMRPGDMTSHLMVEIEKLNKLSKPRKSFSKESNSHGKKNVPGPSIPSNGATTSTGEVANGELPVNRYETYLRVRASRQSRLARGKGKKKKSNDETVCPVCNEKIVGTSEELNEHVDQCLKQKGEDDEEVDVEGEFEEYTWAGQTRIRATSFVEGGLAEAGFKKISKSTEDEDVDLCVDDDDVDVYGTPQYTEGDIIPCSAEDPDEDKQSRALRRAYLRAEKLKAQKPELTDRVRWQQHGESSSNNNAARTSSPDGAATDSSCGTPNPTCSNDGALEEVIESLKVKIKEQEEQIANKQELPKCLICMETYHKPTTSVQCWHVHCEECWLRTLGAKKLCPQCNMITSPADLRGIYL